MGGNVLLHGRTVNGVKGAGAEDDAFDEEAVTDALAVLTILVPGTEDNSKLLEANRKKV